MEIYFLPLHINETDFILDSLNHIDYLDVFRLSPQLIAVLVDSNYSIHHEHSFFTLLETLLSDGQISQTFFHTTISVQNELTGLLTSEKTWETIPIDNRAATFEQFILPLALLPTIKSCIFDMLDAILIETIQFFLKNDLNILQTSKKMFLHRNTLNYRLSTIQQRTGVNIRTFYGAVFFFNLFNN